MGSTTVTDALFMGNVTANAMDNGKKNQVEGTAFAKAMSDVSSPLVTTANDVVKTTTTVEKSSRNPIKNADSKQTGAGEDVKNGNVPDDKTVDKIADKVAEKINAVNDEIKKNLDVTDEEIAVAMQSMGMLPQDLLNPDALKNLMMELSQVEDSMALLTDENLYQGMQNVLKTAELAVADIKADFSIDDETFAQLMNDGQVAEKVETGLNEILKQTVMPVKVETEETETEPGDFRTRVNVEVVRDDNVRTSDLSAGTDTFRNAGNVQKTSDRGDEQQNMTSMNNQTVTVTTNELGDVVETIERYSQGFSDDNRIFSQVTESIKMHVSADTTSMEMMLHPASLGTVNMQISSQNGVITAHLLVQDEAVRAALETQLIALKETFEEQGHHVEAVEVSVANYDLNKNSGQDAQSEERDNALRMGRTARRRLRLDEDFDEDAEDLSEEEKLNADMMRRQGNTLDYMA